MLPNTLDSGGGGGGRRGSIGGSGGVAVFTVLISVHIEQDVSSLLQHCFGVTLSDRAVIEVIPRSCVHREKPYTAKKHHHSVI